MSLPTNPDHAMFMETASTVSGRAWHQGPTGRWFYWDTHRAPHAWVEAIPDNCELVARRACTVLINGLSKCMVPTDSLVFGKRTFNLDVDALAKGLAELDRPKGLLRYVFEVRPTALPGFCVLVNDDDPAPIAYCDAKQDADELAFALNLAVSAWAAKTPGAVVED